MKIYKVQTLNKIAKAGLDVFSEKYAISDSVLNPDAILVRSASMLEMTLGENLEAIARAGSGTNNIPVELCSERGICVFNTPGANANAVKELVLCALLLSSRKIIDGIEWVKSIDDDDLGKAVEKGKGFFAGPELKGKTIGIIGFGAIGRLVAETATLFGMNVVAYDPYASGSSFAKLIDISELYATADYISVHTPFNEKTKGMIDAVAISKMKDGVRLLNFARGEIVDNKAVLEAIKTKKMSSYITDFASKELVNVDGITVMPHLGASTPESENNCAVMAANEICDYLENGNISNSKNLPELKLERNGKVRVTVIYKNIEDICEYISDHLKISIKAMTKGKKNQLCYSIIDTDDEIGETALERLRNNENIKRIRIF